MIIFTIPIKEKQLSWSEQSWIKKLHSRKNCL